MSGRPDAGEVPSPQLAAALFYLSLGWSVVPTHKVTRPAGGGAAVCSCPQGAACVSKGKHPAVAWARYQSEAATAEQIRAWFGPGGPFATYGVGIVTGAISNIFVIDADEGPGKQGADTLLNLQTLNGDLSFTTQARTGGGGRHMIYRHPRDVWVTTGRNVLGPGVDVRGDGGFIVAAPSLHESGSFYLWDEAAHPRTTPIAAAPAWVVEMAAGEPPDGGGTPSRRTPDGGTGEIIRDAWGKVTDGRERHMVGIVCAVIAELARENGALPTAEAVIAEAWPSYERTTRARGASLEADGRGIGLMRQRAGHMLRRAAAGKWKLNKGAASREALPFDPETGEILRQKSTARAPPAILTIAELLALPPPQWLVAGLIPEQALVVPYGPPKSGKSFLMMSAGLHIADGRPWFGHVVQQGAVVYVMGEGIGGMSSRIRAMLARYAMSPDIPFFIIRRAVNFRDPAEVNALEATIRARIGDMPLRLLVIDTLARAMPGADENSAQETGAVIAAADYLKEELRCTVALVHHEGKDGSRGARGTSALRGAWDAAYQIVSHGKRMTLTVVDQKEAEAGQVLRFTMEEVAVGIGRTSLVPVLDETPEAGETEKPPREVSGHAGLVLRALQDIMAGPDSAVLPPFDGLPQTNVRGVSVEALRRKVYERMPTISQEARQKAFVRSIQNLMRVRAIGVRDPWVWLV